MNYQITLKHAAEKDVLNLDDETYARVEAALAALQANPRPRGTRKMHSTEERWRLRVGDYRILYEIDDRRSQITVYRVRHRREAYR
jgi:mRNA interferase RelE/StbE